MTIKELRKVTKCQIYIEQTDMDGAVRRVEYTGGVRDPQISEVKIVHKQFAGFVLCVLLEEDVA